MRQKLCIIFQKYWLHVLQSISSPLAVYDNCHQPTLASCPNIVFLHPASEMLVTKGINKNQIWTIHIDMHNLHTCIIISHESMHSYQPCHSCSFQVQYLMCVSVCKMYHSKSYLLVLGTPDVSCVGISASTGNIAQLTPELIVSSSYNRRRCPLHRRFLLLVLLAF